MSGECSAVEKSMEEILIDLMAEKVMSCRCTGFIDKRIASLPIDCMSIWALSNRDREKKQASR
jgi:hypothetical protein